MDVSINEKLFDALQRHLAREIVASVHHGLQDLNLPRDRLEDIVGTVAFSVCSVVDASRIMQHDGKRVLPVLTFAESADFERVVSSGSTSFMHEYVHGITAEVLDRAA